MCLSTSDDPAKRPGKLLIVNNFYGENSTGALTALLCDGLRRRDWEVTAVYGRGRALPTPGVIRLCPEWYARANSLWAQVTGVPYGGCLLSTWRLERQIRRDRPDAVHLQCINGNFVNIYRLIRWLNRHRIPTVVSLHAEFLYTGNCGHAFACTRWQTGCGHCPDPKRAVRGRLFDRTASSWRKMERAFRGFEGRCVLCPVSDWAKDRAQRSPILKGLPARTVYNGVDREIFHPTGKAPGGYILHVTAHFSPKPDHSKGGAYLLELARRMPGERFLVVGPADPVRELPENVTLLGRVKDRGALAQLYRNASLTVLTSRRETFSMPCAESLCCGTPVVGFRAGGPEEIALAGASEFVPFGDLDGLERAVEKWKTAPADFSGLERYSPDRMTEAFLEIYRSLLRQT